MIHEKQLKGVLNNVGEECLWDPTGAFEGAPILAAPNDNE